MNFSSCVFLEVKSVWIPFLGGLQKFTIRRYTVLLTIITVFTVIHSFDMYIVIFLRLIFPALFVIASVILPTDVNTFQCKYQWC